MRRLLKGVGLGLLTSLVLLWVVELVCGHHKIDTRLVAEDASAPLKRVAIHYAPAVDALAMPVWLDLFDVLPRDVDVQVEVGSAPDFDRLMRKLRNQGVPNLKRFHKVVVGTQITTWSRDRYAALVDADGDGSILAPPRIETTSVLRAGDAKSPYAISKALYDRDPRVADIVFEGGDLAATPKYLFADINLVARNVARGTGDREAIERELHRHFAQDIIWLGDVVGDVPRHHIMMYMVPLDDTTIAVGDVREGVRLLGEAKLPLDDVSEQARRFDHAAELLAARGFKIVRVPAVVLRGAGSYITYTNALFDRRGDQRIVYLPTYNQPALDEAAAHFYEAQGFEVHPIDVSRIYTMNGSLGCLVNVLGRS